MTVDEAFVLAARLDLGECDSREDLVAKLRERRTGVIAYLGAFASGWRLVGMTEDGMREMEQACRAELALVEEALSGLGEAAEVAP